MGKWLLLLFTVVPVVEVALLVQLGALLGPWPTVALVVVTGAVGAWLARAEGTRVFRDWQEAMQLGRLPRDGVVSGLLVLVGGVLLVAPGVLTDALGLALLFPLTRRPIAGFVRRKVEAHLARRMTDAHVVVQTYASASRGSARAEEQELIDMPPT